MVKKTMVGLLIAGLLILIIWLGTWYIAGAVWLVSVLVQYEMIKTLKKGDIKPISPVLIGFTVLLAPVYYFAPEIGMGRLEAVFLLQMIAVSILFVSGIIFKHYNFESIFSSVFTLYYPQLFFVFFYMIIFNGDENLARLMLLVAFTSAAMSDTMAYFVGSFMGKTKLAPSISPKKTVEGSVGGIIGAIIGVVIVALIFDQGRFRIMSYVLLAVILSIFAQLGDLSASMVKRRYGVKDFGSIMPGHGGFFDRVDSTFFVLPIVYMFFKINLNF